jgi:hypothetical protein
MRSWSVLVVFASLAVTGCGDGDCSLGSSEKSRVEDYQARGDATLLVFDGERWTPRVEYHDLAWHADDFGQSGISVRYGWPTEPGTYALQDIGAVIEVDPTQGDPGAVFGTHVLRDGDVTITFCTRDVGFCEPDPKRWPKEPAMTGQIAVRGSFIQKQARRHTYCE